jgi:hypothetical protein
MKTLQTIFVILVLGVGQLTVSHAAEVKLAAGDVAAKDRFGRSVSISGDTAIVGAVYDDDAGGNSGATYIFVRSGTSWTQQTKLTASDTTVGDWFGCSVAISGEVAIVGAWRDDDAGDASGSAYIFVRSGTSWTQQSKLIASNTAAYDNFGVSVAISGDTAIIGAFVVDFAYIFVRNGTSWMYMTMMPEVTQAQRISSCAAERVGPSRRNSPLVTRR